jgi:hypothetical protein
MILTRTQSRVQQDGSERLPKLLHLLPILLRRKLLINKHYSRCSSFSRLTNTNIWSSAQGPEIYAGTYKELARHPAAPAEPAVTLSFQWDKRSRRVAAHPATCWPYHHRTIETAHSPAATPPGPESVEGCAIAPPLPITPKSNHQPAAGVRSSSSPVRAPYYHFLYPKFPAFSREQTRPKKPSSGLVFINLMVQIESRLLWFL